jgi:nicotinamidase-related amidase
MSFQKMINPSTCALALIDFQPAMFQGVQSHDRKTIVDNVQVLARAAKLFEVPTIISTVAKDSFSGPFMPEVTEDVFPDHKVIDRTSINAWLDANFRKAVEATGRKRIAVAGLWTSACTTFPTLDMLDAGYEVFVVADACGDTSPEAHERAIQRVVQAGAVPLSTLQFVFELQQDWARTGTYNGVMDILKALTPYGIQVRFSKWALGEHASEAGTSAHAA